MQKAHLSFDSIRVAFNQWGGFALSLALSLAAYLGLLMQHQQTGTLTFGSTPVTLGWYAVAFLGFGLFLIWIEWRKGSPIILIFASAFLFRAILLFTTPTLSGDVNRYVWEGYLINQGVSPYSYPIDSPQLDHLAIPQRAAVDHAWMASPYLPSAQLMFGLVMGVLPLRPVSFQLALVIFDLISGLIMRRLLQLANLPNYRVYLYLWNPLVILEIAHGAHLDGWMILLTLAAIWAVYASPKRWFPPLLMALATLTKGVPVLLMTVLFWRWRGWQLLLYGLILLGIITPIGLISGWGLFGELDGHGLFAALRIFADRWNYNSGLFYWLEQYLGQTLPAEVANLWAKRTIGLTMGLILGGTWLLSRRNQSVRVDLRLMSIPLMGYVLLSTTVHPWYLLIMVAFLPFLAPAHTESNWGWLTVMPWFYLSWAITLSYWTYINPADLREFVWVRQLEWIPTLILLTIAGLYASLTCLKPDLTATPRPPR